MVSSSIRVGLCFAALSVCSDLVAQSSWETCKVVAIERRTYVTTGGATKPYLNVTLDCPEKRYVVRPFDGNALVLALSGRVYYSSVFFQAGQALDIALFRNNVAQLRVGNHKPFYAEVALEQTRNDSDTASVHAASTPPSQSQADSRSSSIDTPESARPTLLEGNSGSETVAPRARRDSGDDSSIRQGRTMKERHDAETESADRLGSTLSSWKLVQNPVHAWRVTIRGDFVYAEELLSQEQRAAGDFVTVDVKKQGDRFFGTKRVHMTLKDASSQTGTKACEWEFAVEIGSVSADRVEGKWEDYPAESKLDVSTCTRSGERVWRAATWIRE